MEDGLELIDPEREIESLKMSFFGKGTIVFLEKQHLKYPQSKKPPLPTLLPLVLPPFTADIAVGKEGREVPVTFTCGALGMFKKKRMERWRKLSSEHNRSYPMQLYSHLLMELLQHKRTSVLTNTVCTKVFLQLLVN